MLQANRKKNNSCCDFFRSIFHRNSSSKSESAVEQPTSIQMIRIDSIESPPPTDEERKQRKKQLKESRRFHEGLKKFMTEQLEAEKIREQEEDALINGVSTDTTYEPPTL